MSGVSDTFNGYHVWLGIPPAEQPPNHYRLLGITVFETDLDVIDHAADRQMAHVRTFQSGKHGPLSQQILNELSAARLCLLNAEKKTNYDRELRAKLDSAKAAAMPVAQAVPMARPIAPSKSMVTGSTSSAAARPVGVTKSTAPPRTVAATIEPAAVALDFEPIMPDLPSASPSYSTMRTRRLGRRFDWRRQISWAIIAAIGVVSLVLIFYVIGLVRSQNWAEWYDRLERLEAPPSEASEPTSSSRVPAVEAPRPETTNSPAAGSAP